MYDLEAIREKISLPALAEEAGARFDNPHLLMSRCPLPRHAGDRSSQAFTIFDHGRKWKCHSSCPSDANGGDLFSFYMAWKEVDFKTAVAELTERAVLNPVALLPANQKKSKIQSAPIAPGAAWQARAGQFITWAEGNLAGHPGAQEYLEKERGLSPETWCAFRLGYNPTNLYDDPTRWGLDGKKIWLPRGIVMPGFWQGKPWYIKVRRPRPEELIGRYLGEWIALDRLPEVKFGGPRGGHSTLFRLAMNHAMPILILTEGEWDAMLLWEHCPDLCDAGTIGGARSHFDQLDLSLLARYLAVLVVHDDDKAGGEGREYITELASRFGRVKSIAPPAHDLTDFWKSGGNLRAWVAEHVADALEMALIGMDDQWLAKTDWMGIAKLARDES
jgi:hypothetical protein